MPVQPYVSSENGIHFDVSFNDGDVGFTIHDQTEEDIDALLMDVKAQVYLLKQTYKEN